MHDEPLDTATWMLDIQAQALAQQVAMSDLQEISAQLDAVSARYEAEVARMSLPRQSAYVPGTGAFTWYLAPVGPVWPEEQLVLA